MEIDQPSNVIAVRRAAQPSKRARHYSRVGSKIAPDTQYIFWAFSTLGSSLLHLSDKWNFSKPVPWETLAASQRDISPSRHSSTSTSARSPSPASTDRYDMYDTGLLFCTSGPSYPALVPQMVKRKAPADPKSYVAACYRGLKVEAREWIERHSGTAMAFGSRGGKTWVVFYKKKTIG